MPSNRANLRRSAANRQFQPQPRDGSDVTRSIDSAAPSPRAPRMGDNNGYGEDNHGTRESAERAGLIEPDPPVPSTERKRKRREAPLGEELHEKCKKANDLVVPKLEAFLDKNPTYAADHRFRHNMYEAAKKEFGPPRKRWISLERPRRRQGRQSDLLRPGYRAPIRAGWQPPSARRPRHGDVLVREVT